MKCWVIRRNFLYSSARSMSPEGQRYLLNCTVALSNSDRITGQIAISGLVNVKALRPVRSNQESIMWIVFCLSPNWLLYQDSTYIWIKLSSNNVYQIVRYVFQRISSIKPVLSKYVKSQLYFELFTRVSFFVMLLILVLQNYTKMYKNASRLLGGTLLTKSICLKTVDVNVL